MSPIHRVDRIYEPIVKIFGLIDSSEACDYHIWIFARSQSTRIQYVKMIANTLKVRGFSCFQSEWGGFDELKPINLIVGRNNTGKSRLIDLVELLTNKKLTDLSFDMKGSSTLTEAFLRKVFQDRSGGNLGPSYSSYYAPASHWNRYGKILIGRPINWAVKSRKMEVDKSFMISPGNGMASNGISYDDNAIMAVCDQLLNETSTDLYGKFFKRILADRDIRAEKADTNLSLSFDGGGATNIVRRFISSSSLDESLIQVELLQALKTIFGPDGDFDSIEIRLHDTEGSRLNQYWEVFLGEPQKGLVSLSDSGSGLKTVILMLLNLIVVPKMEGRPRGQYIFAFEELENNLHPALLRRLFRFISDYVDKWKCMFFVTTHSNVTLDFFASDSRSQIIHVDHDGATARTKTISAHFDHVNLLRELGARPSDLLQANGIVWLEGPSDRIYVNRFIELFSNGELIEGRDYQCAYYGGSVLAQSQFTAPESENQDLANLLRLNNNIAVVCDGDRTAKTGVGSSKKSRVLRIEAEVALIPQAFLWVTEAKELENYIPGKVWSLVYGIPGVPDPGMFDSFPAKKLTSKNFITRHLNRKSFDKCEFATEASPHLTMTQLNSRFDLAINIQRLIQVIRSWST